MLPRIATKRKPSTCPCAARGTPCFSVGGREAGSSPYGAQDLASNASEWVADWFAENFLRGDVRNPKGPGSGTAKVIRGGGWVDPADRLTSSRRWQANPGHRDDDVGFRCANDFRK
jgi:formylglycine-generating enzyme required for sulfatase activity